MASGSDAVGSKFSKQWPSIIRLGKSTHLAEYSSEATVGLVSEKYDGSNIAITSGKVVASRKSVLLSHPTEEEILQAKFLKVSLAKVSGMFPKLEKLETQFRTMLPGIDIEDVIVYGEFIINFSVEKFQSYKSRGIVVGDIFLFGAGVSFAEDTLKYELEQAVKLLRAQGFTVKGKEQEKSEGGAYENKTWMAALFLNVTLSKLLKQCGFEEVVEQNEVAFPDLAKLYRDKLVRGEIEGVVINFGGEVLKWKGVTEEQHQHMKEIEEAKTDVDTETYEAWKAIAEASKRVKEKENAKEQNPRPISPLEARHAKKLKISPTDNFQI